MMTLSEEARRNLHSELCDALVHHARYRGDCHACSWESIGYIDNGMPHVGTCLYDQAQA
jgi:hypothetical protein